jgi:hypothetical protein
MQLQVQRNFNASGRALSTPMVVVTDMSACTCQYVTNIPLPRQLLDSTLLVRSISPGPGVLLKSEWPQSMTQPKSLRAAAQHTSQQYLGTALFIKLISTPKAGRKEARAKYVTVEHCLIDQYC